MKAANPDHKVVSYINCSAAVKAISDVICTSVMQSILCNYSTSPHRFCSLQTRTLDAMLLNKRGGICCSGMASVKSMRSSAKKLIR